MKELTTLPHEKNILKSQQMGNTLQELQQFISKNNSISEFCLWPSMKVYGYFSFSLMQTLLVYLTINSCTKTYVLVSKPYLKF